MSKCSIFLLRNLDINTVSRAHGERFMVNDSGQKLWIGKKKLGFMTVILIGD